jgi:deazaflavin-dependent oxidoreductase (nitroreductase family)
MAKKYRLNLGTRLINLLFRTMTRFGAGASYRYILTTRGRKTGRFYSTPVDVMQLNGQRYLVAGYGLVNWVRNVRASGEASLSRGGRSEKFRVEQVGPQEAVPILRKYMDEIWVTRAYFDATPESSDEAIVAETLKHSVFRLVSVPS